MKATPLADAAERERFVTEHGRNISVIAPAGVGKTYGIVQRIRALAQHPEAESLLPRLVVVTYSVRAAQEIQQRARLEISRAQVPLKTQRAFAQTFFGTINSFCVRLLSQYGHFLGLPAVCTLPNSEEDLWRRFLIRGARRDPADHPRMQPIFHFYTVERLYDLGQKISPGPEHELPLMPKPDVRPLLNYHPAGLAASTKKAVVTRQDELKAWHEAWAGGNRFHPLPPIPDKIKAPEFIQLWREVMGPLQDWLRLAAMNFGRCVANEYESFRLGEGVMTYDDQVRQALRLLELPAVQREMAREPISVLLDEAQDTDMLQFNLLLRVAGLRSEMIQARDQTFCIVGDFQQAIWAPRSDLAEYRKIHEEISQEPTGMVSRLTVTFRCDRDIIHFVNRVFVTLLDSSPYQASFVELQPRHDAGPGQVARWHCPNLPTAYKKSDDCAAHEARFLAEELRRLQPNGVGAASWQDVAILCPRLAFLHEIQRELERQGIPAQLQSDNESQANSTPRAWLTALVWVASHPEDSYEIAGVLRDIFGVSDDDMARFTGGKGDVLRLDRFTDPEMGPVGHALALLHRACVNAAQMPIHLAVRQLVNLTCLSQRLSSLEDGSKNHVVPSANDLALEKMFELVYRRSAEGATLGELARELREALGKTTPLEEETRNAVQLYTWHKAKGLQWQTVIIPYVFRTFGEKTENYPRVVIGEEGREMIFRDSADFKAGAEEFVRDRDWKQFQRLLYVACTRPEQTLLLIDDEELFHGVKRPNPFCAASLLEFVDGENRKIWDGLPGALEPRSSTAIEVLEEEEATHAHPVSLSDLRRSTAHAQRIPRRTTPHSLAKYPVADAEPEVEAEREETSPPGSGLLYGTWWHKFMEVMPWQADLATREEAFAATLTSSPQPERSRREWVLLRDSSLASWLAQPGLILHPEFPFLWTRGDACLEGVMDLAVFSPEDSSWRVIDWKTNRLDEATVRSVYLAQIEAYREALGATLNTAVHGTLYLTTTGAAVEI